MFGDFLGGWLRPPHKLVVLEVVFAEVFSGQEVVERSQPVVEQPLSALLHLSVVRRGGEDGEGGLNPREGLRDVLGWEEGQSPQLPNVDLQLRRLCVQTAEPVFLQVVLEDPPPVDVAAAK